MWPDLSSTSLLILPRETEEEKRWERTEDGTIIQPAKNWRMQSGRLDDKELEKWKHKYFYFSFVVFLVSFFARQNKNITFNLDPKNLHLQEKPRGWRNLCSPKYPCARFPLFEKLTHGPLQLPVILCDDDGQIFSFTSLCQRLDSRQLIPIRAPEAREKSSAKREHERRRRESPPEAKGERSEPFAGGARDSAKRNRVFVIIAKFLSPSSHVTCQNWIRPFTKKHRFIAQIDSARSNIASTAWRPCSLSPGIGYRVPENVL